MTLVLLVLPVLLLLAGLFVLGFRGLALRLGGIALGVMLLAVLLGRALEALGRTPLGGVAGLILLGLLVIVISVRYTNRRRRLERWMGRRPTSLKRRVDRGGW